MHKSCSVIALHGFLGRPSDFDCLKIPNLLAWDIFAEPIFPLTEWAQKFNQKIAVAQGILGYSMGGRLLLHLLADAPHKYSFAIIMAANPGLKKDEDRPIRRVNDHRWADRFLVDDWAELTDNWHQQPVLKSAQTCPRLENEFDRKKLSDALRQFSLAEQQDLRPMINRLSIPILWLTPQNELGLLDGITLKNPFSKCIAVDGSHRFFMEKPELVRSHIVDFINSLGHKSFLSGSVSS